MPKMTFIKPDGSRVVVVVRHEGKRHLSIMSADGTNAHTLAGDIEIEGAARRVPSDGDGFGCCPFVVNTNVAFLFRSSAANLLSSSV